jgi:hypothetical protein
MTPRGSALLSYHKITVPIKNPPPKANDVNIVVAIAVMVNPLLPWHHMQSLLLLTAHHCQQDHIPHDQLLLPAQPPWPPIPARVVISAIVQIQLHTQVPSPGVLQALYVQLLLPHLPEPARPPPTTKDKVNPTPVNHRNLSARHGNRRSNQRRADLDRRIPAAIKQNLKADEEWEDKDEDKDDESTLFSSTKRMLLLPSISLLFVQVRPSFLDITVLCCALEQMF